MLDHARSSLVVSGYAVTRLRGYAHTKSQTKRVHQGNSAAQLTSGRLAHASVKIIHGQIVIDTNSMCSCDSSSNSNQIMAFSVPSLST